MSIKKFAVIFFSILGGAVLFLSINAISGNNKGTQTDDDSASYAAKCIGLTNQIAAYFQQGAIGSANYLIVQLNDMANNAKVIDEENNDFGKIGHVDASNDYIASGFSNYHQQYEHNHYYHQGNQSEIDDRLLLDYCTHTDDLALAVQKFAKACREKNYHEAIKIGLELAIGFAKNNLFEQARACLRKTNAIARENGIEIPANGNEAFQVFNYEANSGAYNDGYHSNGYNWGNSGGY